VAYYFKPLQVFWLLYLAFCSSFRAKSDRGLPVFAAVVEKTRKIMQSKMLAA